MAAGYLVVLGVEFSHARRLWLSHTPGQRLFFFFLRLILLYVSVLSECIYIQKACFVDRRSEEDIGSHWNRSYGQL